MGTMARAKASGPSGNTVAPPRTSGKPALGWMNTGTPEAALRRRRLSYIASGPKPQLRPRASTRSADRVQAAVSTSAPVSSRPCASKVKLTHSFTSRPVRRMASRAASAHSRASPKSVIVSMSNSCAPSSSAATNASSNCAYASWGSMSP